MKTAKHFLISAIAISMLLLTACTGPKGPTGPTGLTGATGPAGADGSNVQTTYIFDVTPVGATGEYEATVPDIVTDSTSEDYSTVNCFVCIESEVDSYALPFDDTTTGTYYFYSIEDGKATLFWSTTGTLPTSLEFIVTLVNK